jgi:hypothetical protein
MAADEEWVFNAAPHSPEVERLAAVLAASRFAIRHDCERRMFAAFCAAVAEAFPSLLQEGEAAVLERLCSPPPENCASIRAMLVDCEWFAMHTGGIIRGFVQAAVNPSDATEASVLTLCIEPALGWPAAAARLLHMTREWAMLRGCRTLRINARARVPELRFLMEHGGFRVRRSCGKFDARAAKCVTAYERARRPAYMAKIVEGMRRSAAVTASAFDTFVLECSNPWSVGAQAILDEQFKRFIHSNQRVKLILSAVAVAESA